MCEALTHLLKRSSSSHTFEKRLHMYRNISTCRYMYTSIYVYKYTYIYKAHAHLLKCSNSSHTSKKVKHTILIPIMLIHTLHNLPWRQHWREKKITYIYIYIYVHVYVYIYIYMYIFTYICIYTYMYLYIYVYVHVYVHIHIYIYIYTYKNVCNMEGWGENKRKNIDLFQRIHIAHPAAALKGCYKER